MVDVRTEFQYDEAHIPDAICIPVRRAGFGSKLAWVAEPGQPLIFAGRDDDDARVAAELASAVGLRTVGGILAGGMTSWREEQLPVESVRRMTVDELARGAARRRAATGRRARARRVTRPVTCRARSTSPTTT